MAGRIVKISIFALLLALIAYLFSQKDRFQIDLTKD
jgi:hypothetical protein